MRGDWSRFARTLETAGHAMARSGTIHPRQAAWAFPQREGYDPPRNYGSSLNFALELQLFHASLLVPERECVVAEAGPPELERFGPHDQPCEAGCLECPCWRCHGRIGPPERLPYDPKPLMRTMLNSGYSNEDILRSVKEQIRAHGVTDLSDPTRLVCPTCWRSGFDVELEAQLALAGGLPDPEPRVPQRRG